MENERGNKTVLLFSREKKKAKKVGKDKYIKFFIKMQLASSTTIFLLTQFKKL